MSYKLKINLTPAQLASAQLGAEVRLNTGHDLRAVQLKAGDGWKYILNYGGIVADVRYAEHGLEAALEVLNATDDDSL